MKIITLDGENINREHICCAITEKKGENCVAAKKAWLAEAFESGLIFKKADVRGKVFIEYLPAEKAWNPIVAPNYLFINCLWVSGQYKGKGLSSLLFEECLADARRVKKDGLAIISANRKKPFLSDPAYLEHKGFKVADTASPYFTLMALQLNGKAAKPEFLLQAKQGRIKDQGAVLYYSNQCPFTEKYAPMLKAVADEHKIPFKLVKLNSLKEAQKAPTPWTTYALFYNGEFITNEILTESKFLKLAGQSAVQ